ncbi:MAG: LysR family transcriptional regulator, partial [Albidovulum sp.]|nr:LysR family transcriptional regulator [Albidovulum sp.]
MKLNQLKYFIAVAEAGSTTKAAEILNLTQPAITRGILQLEMEIGVKLFERLPRSMRLTRFGEAYLRHARSVFVQLDNAQAEMGYLLENPVEEIVIGAGPTWLRATLPEVISDLSRAYPEVSIRVRGGYDEQLLTMLDRGEVAFVLTETSRNRMRSDLEQEPLIKCEYVVAGRRRHPLAGNRKVKLSQLLNYPWAMP